MKGYRQLYSCPDCGITYGAIRPLSEVNPMEYLKDTCLKCKKSGYVYEFMPEARE